MIDNWYPDYFDIGRIDVQSLPLEQPDLKTGVGHGHYRPSSRNRQKRGHYDHIHNKTKMSKESRRRNRK